MTQLKMAACGIDCAECASYKVTVHQDIKSAELLVPWYRGMGWIGENEGAEAVMKKAPLCKGCWNVTEDCFFKCGCGSRDFRVCCAERKINHCGECGDFPCGHYQKFASESGHHQKAMERLVALKANARQVAF